MWVGLIVPLCSLAAAPAPGAGTAAAAGPASELSRAQAVALAQQRYSARAVRAELAEQAGRRMYVLRMLSENGKVWIVRIDAHSGAAVP
jgi:uncharacterized membrane protein YkoI